MAGNGGAHPPVNLKVLLLILSRQALMAELRPQPEQIYPFSASLTVKKRNNFLSLEDLIIMKVISALLAHAAKKGSVCATYAKGSDKVTNNDEMTENMS